MRYSEFSRANLNEARISQYDKVLSGKWNSPEELITYLYINGFGQIGDGYFSDVFAKPGGKIVVKVSHKEDPTDDGFPRFVEYVNRHKSNVHLPKVGKLCWFNDFYAVSIEQLEPLNDQDFFQNYYTTSWMVCKGKSLPDHLQAFYDDNSDLIDTVADLAKTFGGVESLDLHGFNIMRRGSTPVLIDLVKFAN